MADPLSILGAVVSVAGLIDILSRAIGVINDLRAQYKDADLMLMSLKSQLLVLRTGLSKIWDWAETNPTSTHYQLFMDLDSVILCCQTLTSRLDSQLMIERQTSALTLLLTACNTKSLSEQQELLSVSAVRTVISTVEHDSSSLIVHDDRSSICTVETDTMSNAAATFSFDSELVPSRVYDRAWRSTMLTNVMPRTRRTLSDATTIVPPEAPMLVPIYLDSETQNVENKPPFALAGVKEHKILLIGAGNSGKTTLPRQTQIMWGNEDQKPTREEKLHWKAVIFRDFCRFFIVLLRDRIEGLDETLTYPPTEQDLLHVSVQTVSFTNHVFDVGHSRYSVYDVSGVRSQRKKWTHAIKDADIVLFQAPIGSYDECLYEDKSTQLMHESLMLCESVVNWHLFSDKKIFLNFTTAEIFERKVQSGIKPLADYHHKFDGNPAGESNFF
ncbi:G-protein alpha subunit-domain-containing protein [Podospora australis]|uniref:G-protein alpha subunit-domain-containing protein n=1 Tax=Podospora australis TaxID=1536484 RepID=A0AAN7AHT8_9PEZI|nr:G-protein alpha subunit-domain-containing protein [Podospora australis]